MKISRKAWDSFIKRLGRLDEAAAGKVVAYMEGRDYTTKEGRKNLLDYAFAIATRYGEGAAEVACQMYDAVAAASGKKLPTAEPAKTATYGEVARAVNGALLLSQEAKAVGAAVGRTVRQAGADTTAQNAVRDGAEWAWIPSGDSCSYCLMLASQGWVKASAKVLKGNHAQHIHNNCDCTFAIRHDGRSTVEGYDPDALREQWDAADGRTWQEKLRYLDRKKYATNREAIRERKKVEYRARKAAKNIENKDIDDIMVVEGDQTKSITQLSRDEFAMLFHNDPSTFGLFNPVLLKRELESRGFDVRPLGRGRHKGQAFENGGGYIIRHGGNKAIEYHPAKQSRHGGRYYRTSDPVNGKRWFDMRGNEIDIKATGNAGRQILK